MKHKFTPGPWRAGMSSVLVWSGKGWAKFAGHHGTAVIEQVEARANLKLAASAPDLLATLELIANGPFPDWVQSPRDHVKFADAMARGAIARATGETA